jgi:futalosine hydrolase
MPALPHHLLLISATRAEAEPLRAALPHTETLDLPLGFGLRSQAFGRRLDLLHLGIGKVNTAAGLALALERLRPQAVLQFGIGGGYVGSFTSIGMVLAASEEIHLDSGERTDDGWRGMADLGFPLLEREESYYNRFPTDAQLTSAFSDTLGLPSGRFGTAESVSGSFDLGRELQERFDVSIESMEGAAAAQTCLALSVPFAEVRAVSNIVGERDRSAWNIPAAIRAVNGAVLDALHSEPV